MAQTETLRTKVDNLQWEVNRLDAENRRLRDDNPETAARVDLEAHATRERMLPCLIAYGNRTH